MVIITVSVRDEHEIDLHHAERDEYAIDLHHAERDEYEKHGA